MTVERMNLIELVTIKPTITPADIKDFTKGELLRLILLRESRFQQRIDNEVYHRVNGLMFRGKIQVDGTVLIDAFRIANEELLKKLGCVGDPYDC